MDTGVAPEMRGVCSGSRSARAIHTTRGKQKRFPYYPSRQERRIFKYVFFHDERSFTVRRYEDVKLAGAYLAAAVNVGAILFQLLEAYQNNDPFDSTTDFCVYFLALAEALVIAFAVCAVLHYLFMLRLYNSGRLGWPWWWPWWLGGAHAEAEQQQPASAQVKPGAFVLCTECILN